MLCFITNANIIDSNNKYIKFLITFHQNHIMKNYIILMIILIIIFLLILMINLLNIFTIIIKFQYTSKLTLEDLKMPIFN
jgi:hypothetical protein